MGLTDRSTAVQRSLNPPVSTVLAMDSTLPALRPLGAVLASVCFASCVGAVGAGLFAMLAHKS